MTQTMKQGAGNQFIAAALAALICAPSVLAQESIDRVFSTLESVVRERTNKIALPSPTTTQAAAGNNSSLDTLLGDKAGQQKDATQAMSKAEFLAEYERLYRDSSNDNGHIPSARRRPDKLAEVLAQMLPVEYGISTGCVQVRRTDGRIAASSQAMTIAFAIFDILDQLLPTGQGADLLRGRIQTLSQRGAGCPNDFPAIKQFLEEITAYSKTLIETKQAAVAEKRAKAQEQAEQARHTTEQRREAEDRQKRLALAQEAELRQQQQELAKKRSAMLRSGTEKPASFRDHLLMHEYRTGDQFFSSPMVNADRKVYLFGTGVLEREDGKDLIFKGHNGYIVVRRDRSTATYGDLRINRLTVVLGRYIGNTQYTTVVGAVRTAPVIEAIAISMAPV